MLKYIPVSVQSKVGLRSEQYGQMKSVPSHDKVLEFDF